MPTYSRLCGNDRIPVTVLSNVFVNGVPWRLFRDKFNNLYCESIVYSGHIVELNSKDYVEAAKETIEYVNTLLN